MHPNESAGPKSPVFAIASVIVGALGLVVPFLPVDMTGVRAYIALPAGILGLVLAGLGFTGRRGRPVAAAGAVISALVVVLGLTFLANLVV